MKKLHHVNVRDRCAKHKIGVPTQALSNPEILSKSNLSPIIRSTAICSSIYGICRFSSEFRSGCLKRVAQLPPYDSPNIHIFLPEPVIAGENGTTSSLTIVNVNSIAIFLHFPFDNSLMALFTDVIFYHDKTSVGSSVICIKND